jgi:hypothetical protein
LAFTVLTDANVLYPVYLRDALLRLAYAGVYQIRWSDQILYEMAHNIKKKVPESQHDKVDGMVAKMNAVVKAPTGEDAQNFYDELPY